jgi:methylthioribulose-1-phosphate dehydratase
MVPSMSSSVVGTFAQASSALVETGRRFYQRGWVQGTSGNFSAVVATHPLTLCITPSAAHKGLLAVEDFLKIDESGRPVSGQASSTGSKQKKPSAETLLHLEIVKARGAAAVLHTHSVWSTMLSERELPNRGLAIEGYEMLKGLSGIETHEHREWVPIVNNDQDMPRLAAEVRDVLMKDTAAHAFLISGHGLYTWGESIAEAERHVEILEFLFEVVGRRL